MRKTKEVIMSEDQEAMLKTSLQLDERRKIPQSALDLYSEFKITLDRLGVHHVSPEMLALIPIILNRVARPAPKTFVDEVQDHGDVRYGTRVIVLWRKRHRAAKFLCFENGKVKVEMDDDDAEFRTVSVTAVRLATSEDINKLREKVD